MSTAKRLIAWCPPMTDQTDQQQDAGEQAWRVVELHGMTVATKGEPAPGVEMRNLQGMCELANAAARDVARLEARVRELEDDIRILRSDIA
jgi:hypothetical protein